MKTHGTYTHAIYAVIKYTSPEQENDSTLDRVGGCHSQDQAVSHWYTTGHCIGPFKRPSQTR